MSKRLCWEFYRPIHVHRGTETYRTYVDPAQTHERSFIVDSPLSIYKFFHSAALSDDF